MIRHRFALIPLLAVRVVALHAQSASAIRPPDTEQSPAACGYVQCALAIAPVWNGLALVRGPERAPAANLHFFWPRQVESVFVGDSAHAYAVSALHTRRLAAALTDLGGALLITSAVRGLRAGGLVGATRATALVGAGAFALSVPLHFSADGLLSRAVWWHNAAFAR